MLISSVCTMKTKYLFCAAQGEITLRTVFVDVYVGHTKQELRDFDTVSRLAKQSSYYFQKWTNEVQLFYDRCVESVCPDGCDDRAGFARVSLQVTELRRLLVAGQFTSFINLFLGAREKLVCKRWSANSAQSAAKNRAAAEFLQTADVINLSNHSLSL